MVVRDRRDDSVAAEVAAVAAVSLGLPTAGGGGPTVGIVVP